MSHPDLLRMPDGALRAFFGGIRSTNAGETNNALKHRDCARLGDSVDPQAGEGRAGDVRIRNGCRGHGAREDGTPISTWSGTPGLGFHFGVNPADPDGKIPQSGCCRPGRAPGRPEARVRVGHSPARARSTPGTEPPSPGASVQRACICSTARDIRPSSRLCCGGSKPPNRHLVIKGDGNEHANIAAAPEGRLWLMWERNGTIYATRTNRAATKLGAPNTLKPPGGNSIFRLNGEGSAGPLDLIANIQTGSTNGFWHQQVWPRLQLSASSKKGGNGRVITVRVADAGDPVSGASVKAGGKTLNTAANGKATLRQARAARVKATASKAGYAPAVLTVR
jgi:hypothetical protein